MDLLILDNRAMMKRYYYIYIQRVVYYNSNSMVLFFTKSFMQCQSNPNSNTAYLAGCLHKAVEAVIDKTAVVDEVGMGISFIVQ